MTARVTPPLQDSFIDFAVLAALDPSNFSAAGESYYAEMMRETRALHRPAWRPRHRLESV
jgi:hypothetical protein